MVERRKFQRFEKSLKLKYHVLYSLGFGKSVKEGVGSTLTIDVSEGGISLIVTDAPIPVGSFLEVEVQIPDQNVPVYLKGKVVRFKELSDNKYELGMQFEYKFETDSQLLHDFLSKN